MSRDNQRPVFSHTRNSEEAVARMSSTKFVFLKISQIHRITKLQHGKQISRRTLTNGCLWCAGRKGESNATERLQKTTDIAKRRIYFTILNELFS